MDYDAYDEWNLLGRILMDENAEPTNLPLSLLRSITNNFSDDLAIGCGGFSTVYMGLLQNGIVAVKKLIQLNDMHEKLFQRELDSLMRVRHKNIVRFLGYCSDTQGKLFKWEGKNVVSEERQRCFCFEFLPQGSLDKYISDAAQGLDWMTRYQIIKGICEGLHYLHQQRIVHLDLKPANIFLDNDMVPKIADFGHSLYFDEKQSRARISHTFGSLGYTSPESYDGLMTFKSDIYSIGVIILEMLTGHKGYPEIENILQGWSTRIETSLGDARLEPVRVCAEIGIECIDFNPEKRPDTQCILERLAEMERIYGFMKIDLCTSTATNSLDRIPSGLFVIVPDFIP
ncbi:hypothetical protein EJB05_29402, partial [Eragrostis curvula]